MSTTSISTGSKASLKHNRRIRKKTKEELNSENYRRQMETLFKKIDRMVTFFGVDIFVHARWKSGGFRLWYMSCIIASSKLSCCWTLGSSKLWRSWTKSRSRSSSSSLSWAGYYTLYSLHLFSSLTSLLVWPVRTVPAALIPYCWSVVRSFELVKRLSRWTACCNDLTW